jgi:hypothetical protein
MTDNCEDDSAFASELARIEKLLTLLRGLPSEVIREPALAEAEISETGADQQI